MKNQDIFGLSTMAISQKIMIKELFRQEGIPVSEHPKDIATSTLQWVYGVESNKITMKRSERIRSLVKRFMES